MTRPRRALARWTAALVVAATAGPALTACRDGDHVDTQPGDPAAVLETQRDQVRRLVGEVATGAAAALDGRVRTATGRWEGCTSVFPEGHRDFRYRASARIDAGPTAARPYLDALAALLADAGLPEPVAGERPGGRTLTTTTDGVEITLAELPAEGDHVLLAASGPCVEVPDEARDDWGRRTDPTPIVG